MLAFRVCEVKLICAAPPYAHLIVGLSYVSAMEKDLEVAHMPHYRSVCESGA